MKLGRAKGMTFTVVAMVLFAPALTTPATADTPTAAAGCAIDLVTEGGACAERIPEVPLTVNQIEQTEQKEELRAAVKESLEGGAGLTAVIAETTGSEMVAYAIPPVPEARGRSIRSLRSSP